MQTAIENLHDKWGKSNWHQLWADDFKAFVFLAIEGSPKVMMVVSDDGDVANGVIMPFSEGMDEWNRQINEHLADKALAL